MCVPCAQVPFSASRSNGDVLVRRCRSSDEFADFYSASLSFRYFEETMIDSHQYVYSAYMSGSLFLVLTQLSVDGYILGELVLMSSRPLLNLLTDL
jgi:hypothetical protein